MKKISTILFMAFVFVQILCSQFKEGYIINNDNDTIRGFVKWEGSIINSGQCEFKLNIDDQPHIYKPGEISAFRFNNSKFFSSREILTGNQTKTVFIEWLIKGRASLYSYSGDVPYTKYFLLSEDGSLSELTNTTVDIAKKGMSYQLKKQEYISTLQYNFRDCPALQQKISSTAFNSKSLINITKGYHELTCKTEQCVIFEEKERKMRLEWGIFAAFLNSDWKIRNGKIENMIPSNTMGVGVSLNVTNLPALSPKFSLKISPAIFSTLYRFDTANVADLKYVIYYSLIKDDRVCKIAYARIPVQLTYRFSHKKFSPYLSAGGTLNLRLSYKQYDEYLVGYATSIPYGNSDILNLTPLQYGINTGFGFEYVTSPNFKVNLGYDFEYCSRQYGTFADEHSKVLNNIVYLRAYFL